MNTEKDTIAMSGLEDIIQRLMSIKQFAVKQIGKSRPILNASEIELIKDHLDLIVKYTRL